jgi:hypothetical protein
MIRAGIACLATLVWMGAADASVVISSAPTKHMDCSAGVCSPTAKNAVLNTGDLAAMLAGTDVEVTTGSGAVTIGIMSPLTWASSHRLTLDAQHSISIRSTVVVEGTGGLTITLDDGAAGSLNFYPGGSIAFWDTASSLVISGNTYTLVNDIATLASDVNANPSGFFALAKDYNASGDGDYGDAVVSTPLAGTFEGLGHAIIGLSFVIYGSYDVGLFAEIDGTARDLQVAASMDCEPYLNAAAAVGLLAAVNGGSLKNISVSGGIYCPFAGMAGGLVGDSEAPAQIAFASAAVSIGGKNVHVAGGLVGTNTGTIRNASATGNISTGVAAGGLVGSTAGLVQDSHATGRVSNSYGYQVGGLAGEATGTILRAFATGNVSGKRQVGGLVGYASNLTVDSSFATGTAGSEQQAGGLVGSGANVTLVNAYARGAATGTNTKVGYAGGLVGMSSSGATTASYSTGAPTGAKYTGGSVGDISGSVSMTDAYWDLDSSGVSNPASGVGNHANYPGVTGLTDAQLKSGLPAGFDPAVWAQNASINNGYPYLIVNPPQ